MKIKKLTIKNFKTITSKELVFDSQINVIAGPNGSGKSSIVDAITYLLTDELPENISEYINWTTGEDAKLHMLLEHDGKDIDYAVTLKVKGSTERVLKISGDDEVYRNSDCLKKIKELYNPKLLYYSGIATQHEATSLLFESPAERLKKLKEILSVERVNDVVARMKEDLDVARAMEDHLSLEIGKILVKKYNYVKIEPLPDIDDLENRLKALELLYAEYQEEVETYNQEQLAYSMYLKEKESVAVNQQKIKVLEGKLQYINLDQTLDVDTKYLEELANEVADLEKQSVRYIGYVKELQAYEKSKVDYQKKIGQLEKDIAGITVRRLAKPEYDADALDGLQKAINALTVDLREQESHLALVKAGKCGTCGQDYDGDPVKTQERIAAISKELADKKALHIAQVAASRKYDSDLTSNRILIGQKESLENSLKDYQNMLNALVAPEKVEYDAAHYETKAKELQAMKKQRKEFLDREEREKKITESNLKIQNEIDLLQEQIAAFEKKETPVKPVAPVFLYTDEMKQAQNDLAIYNEKVAQFEALTKFNADIKVQEDADKVNLNKLQGEFDKKSVEVRNLDLGKRLLEKEFSAYLIDTGSSYIKNNMNVFFNKVYGRYDIDFRRDSKSVQFFYSPDKVVYKPVGVAAGFEKQLISMGFRIATSNMQNTKFYLLDEADSSAEDDNSLLMYETLLSEDIEQLICVTHKECTKEYLVNERNAKLFSLAA